VPSGKNLKKALKRAQEILCAGLGAVTLPAEVPQGGWWIWLPSTTIVVEGHAAVRSVKGGRPRPVPWVAGHRRGRLEERMRKARRKSSLPAIFNL
jgi:hypothetical protein